MNTYLDRIVEMTDTFMAHLTQMPKCASPDMNIDDEDLVPGVYVETAKNIQGILLCIAYDDATEEEFENLVDLFDLFFLNSIESHFSMEDIAILEALDSMISELPENERVYTELHEFCQTPMYIHWPPV